MICIKFIYNSIGCFTGSSFYIQYFKIIKGFFRSRQLINFVAGFFTFSATNALGCIMQNAKAVRVAFKILVGCGMGFAYHTSGGSNCCCSQAA